MTSLDINNPFGAPVYYLETVESTMDVSRELAQRGEPHGTVIAAGFQKKGRGRLGGRVWLTEKNENLLFTILLRYHRIENIPAAITLRTGIAVSRAVENYAAQINNPAARPSPRINGTVTVKWPNDIMIDNKKAAGILCEATSEGIVHAGIGVNFAQKEFPSSINKKATSIAIALGIDIAPNERFVLLEKILASFYNELATAQESLKSRLEQRLYKKNEKVIFIEGAADSGREITGTLSGITETGELLIKVDEEKENRSFITGELKLD
ncbi:MAG: biotin--[acetyl-CoA-carboxylase] ligase [Spirochaetes bacterium]|nr:biotin--[acetyl-CoA-carboxylase] ligase [Spirochaetota bacterium]